MFGNVRICFRLTLINNFTCVKVFKMQRLTTDVIKQTVVIVLLVRDERALNH